MVDEAQLVELGNRAYACRKVEHGLSTGELYALLWLYVTLWIRPVG